MRFGIGLFGRTIDFVYIRFLRNHRDKTAGGSFRDMVAAEIDLGQPPKSIIIVQL